MDSSITRRYCWRVGAVWSDLDTQRCRECGLWWSSHSLANDGECGCFAPCGDHGHGCDLPPGHNGEHTTKPCAESNRTDLWRAVWR